MSTYETAPDQFTTVDGLRFCYRQLGQSDGVPLVLLMHFRGTMDHWDPALVNRLAASRPVVLIDAVGVGRSGGEVPGTLHQMAVHYLRVLDAILDGGSSIAEVDLLGVSLGGCVALLAALLSTTPASGVKVRSLVLCCTTLSGGEGVAVAPPDAAVQIMSAQTAEEEEAAFLKTMFTPSPSGQAAGRASWGRIVGARRERTAGLSPSGTRRQARAFARYMEGSEEGDVTYARVGELRMPILIATGSDDIVVPTQNSYCMWNKLRGARAQLHMYPDSGHGFLYQYAEEFAELVNDFLQHSAGRQTSHI